MDSSNYSQTYNIQDIIDKIEYDSLNNDLKEIIAMLTSTIKTMKNKIKQ